MAPRTPGRTRTAPPQMPASWWSAPRIRTYLLFDATGIIYFLVAFVAIRMIRALADGPIAWQAAMKSLENPIYIAFHVLSLVSVIFVGVRFFRLFPKAQPRNLPVPPDAVIQATLYAVWIGVTIGLSAILAGVIL
jgi:fumarate reductase subunit C